MNSRAPVRLTSVAGVLSAMTAVGTLLMALDAQGGSGERVDDHFDHPTDLSLPFYTDATLTPRWVDFHGEADGLHRTAGFQLTNQIGRTVNEDDLDGRIHIASFFFTSCGQVCPMTIHNLKDVQRAFAGDDDVVLLSFSVTPEMDSVSVLRGFGEAHGIDPGRWHLLTGDRSTIFDLADSSYFVELEEDELYEADELFHTETVVLVDSQRKIRGVYNGTLAFDMGQLVEDIHTLRGTG